MEDYRFGSSTFEREYLSNKGILHRMDVGEAIGLALQSLLAEAMFGEMYTKLPFSAISRLLAGETRLVKFFPQQKAKFWFCSKDRWLHWRLHTGWRTLASQSWLRACRRPSTRGPSCIGKWRYRHSESLSVFGSVLRYSRWRWWYLRRRHVDGCQSISQQACCRTVARNHSTRQRHGLTLRRDYRYLPAISQYHGCRILRLWILVY